MKYSCGKQQTGRIENTGPTRSIQVPGVAPDTVACAEVISVPNADACVTQHSSDFRTVKT